MGWLASIEPHSAEAVLFDLEVDAAAEGSALEAPRCGADPLNRPTAMYGFDANRRRLKLTLNDLVVSRS
ncbi:hypothetical protein [Streptomyces sp. NBC_01198]|uniref:hypothetical protein n=1 Tax=Streptomyces sp. NBC_01198 TaxID=2903769 RepID=UPI002E15083C|nr:hypothetical protein OG702_00055 [Streptomyces sp. NBC_01198]WSR66430.1 hypothetical protein OG702_35305 [Streptomyces sp. NBC_01198]